MMVLPEKRAAGFVWERRMRRRARGISLVEVTIALGLLTFGMVSILAMLPVGLNTLREARESATQVNILQQVGAEYAAMPFDAIPETRVFYFDLEGRLLNGDLSATHYRVTATVNQPDYPGMPAQIGTRLKRVEIEMVALAGGPESQPMGEAAFSSLKLADSGM